MRLWTRVTLVGALTALTLTPAAGASAASQAVTNGGFEASSGLTQADGWALTGSSICTGSVCGGDATPASGTHFWSSLDPAGDHASAITSNSPTGSLSQVLVAGPSAAPVTVTFELRRRSRGAAFATSRLVLTQGSHVLRTIDEIPTAYVGQTVTITAADLAFGQTLTLATFCDNPSNATVSCDAIDVDDVSGVAGPPPAAPVLSATQPASGSDANSPRVRGTLGAGDADSVAIYGAPACSGPVLATGSAADFTGAGIAVSVADNSVTTLTATASNLAGRSSCSNDLIYVERSTVPDAVPPATTIAKAPKRRVSSAKAKFLFVSSEPGSRFECQVDKDPFKACGASTTLKVKVGKHVLQVRAIDLAGNVDPTPAATRWTYSRKRRPA